MKARAPFEPRPSPARCQASRTGPVCATVRNDGEQRLGPFFFVLYPTAAPSAMRRARRRTITVQRQACRREGVQSLKHQRAREPAQRRHRLLVLTIERATDGSHIRQTPRAGYPPHHRVIPLLAQVREPSVAEQKMRNQQHPDRAVTEDGADLQLLDAPAQPALRRRALAEGLQQHAPGEGAQRRVLGSSLRQHPGRDRLSVQECSNMCA